MTRDKDELWMRRALVLAQRAYVAGEVPVGAIVVMDGALVGEGWNRPISAADPSAHAEILALREAALTQNNYRLPGSTLYVTIEPCTMCFGAMVHARVERVVFGATEPKAGVLVSNTALVDSDFYNHRFDWRGGVCETECSELIQRFFRQRRDSKKRQASGLSC